MTNKHEKEAVKNKILKLHEEIKKLDETVLAALKSDKPFDKLDKTSLGQMQIQSMTKSNLFIELCEMYEEMYVEPLDNISKEVKDRYDLFIDISNYTVDSEDEIVNKLKEEIRKINGT